MKKELSTIHQKYLNENKSLWEAWTAVHLKSDFYDLPSFREGKDSLRKIEINELIEVQGKTMLHLQCHFGMDTLSWARRGARTTGVDFSASAIEAAQNLADELDLKAEFICSDIYELKNKLHTSFDIVFTSYGVISWLPDLGPWAELISSALNPGGRFYIVEFHPLLWTWHENEPRIAYSYFNKNSPDSFLSDYSYADSKKSTRIDLMEHNWNHSLGEVITALSDAGLKIEFLHEFPFLPFEIYNNCVGVGDQQWQFAQFGDKIPYVFSIQARKEL